MNVRLDFRDHQFANRLAMKGPVADDLARPVAFDLKEAVPRRKVGRIDGSPDRFRIAKFASCHSSRPRVHSRSMLDSPLPCAANEFVGHDVPDNSLGTELEVEVVRPRERARLEIKEFNAGLGNSAEVQVDHGRPVDRLDVVGDRLVRPRPARHDHHLVKVPAKHFGGRAVMAARRVEASSIDGKRSVHKGFAVGSDSVKVKRRPEDLECSL